MKRFIKSKKGIALIATLAALAIAGGAYAYFTTTGSGSGTANAGNASTITLHASWPDGIVPGDGGQTVTFTGDNPNPSTSEEVRTISFVSVTSTNSACQGVIDNGSATQFTMADVTSNTVIPAGDNAFPLTGTGTLIWNDSTTQDQTACAGAPLTLNVSSN